MKTNRLLSVVMLCICVGLIIPAYLFFQQNAVSKANRLRSKAKKEYFAREYLKAFKTYETLFDATDIKDDAASINYANAAFMSSNILLGGFYGTSDKQNKLPDSVLNQLAGISESEYTRLRSAGDNKIASVASNQLGYSTVKAGNLFADEKTDSILAVALDHFKDALLANPLNDSARYNYELLKKIALFPETILSQTRALVAAQKYREASALLEKSMRRDPRLTKQKDFLDRIKTIINIDSVNTRRI